MFKRGILIIIFLLLVSFVYATDCYDNTANSIPICSCIDLNKTRLGLTSNYELQNNIDCSDTVNWDSGKGFLPIGDSSSKFTGTFDGQNFVISNLFINRTTTSYIGLFGYTYTSANISNVGVTNVNISGKDYTGGVVGANVALTGSIDNVFSTGWVLGEDYVGGAIGYNSGLANNSYSTCTVKGIATSVGGFVGYNSASSAIGKVYNSYATGDVLYGTSYIGGFVGQNYYGTTKHCFATGNVTGDSIVGGFAGYSAYGTIENTSAAGDVRAFSNFGGGLVGRPYDGVINLSYATGDVISAGSYGGGITSFCQGGTEFYNLYYTGNVSGSSSVGGIIGYIEYGVVKYSYSTGSVYGTGNVGGILGYGYGTDIYNCYSTANISGGSKVGGIVGYHYFGDTMYSYFAGIIKSGSTKGTLIGDRYWPTDCNSSFWNNETVGVTANDCSTGGTGKSTADLKNVATFTDLSTLGLSIAWDFVGNPNDDVANLNVWDLDGETNNGYPFLVGLVADSSDRTAPSVTLNGPFDNQVNDSLVALDITFNCSVTDNVGLSSVSLFVTDNSDSNLVLNQTSAISGASNSSSWTLTLALGNYSWNCLANDSSNNSAFADSDFSLILNDTSDRTDPIVTLISPENGHINVSADPLRVMFNCSVTDERFLSNVSLYLSDNSSNNFVLNQTSNVGGVSNSSTWILDLTNGNYSWSCFVYDNWSNGVFASSNFSIFVNFSDLDGDGLTDSRDLLVGTGSTVEGSGTSNIVVSIGGNSSSATYSGENTVEFQDDGVLFMNFSHNFSLASLDLTKMGIIKTASSLIVNLSDQLQGNKTLFVNDNNFVSLCVKDAHVEVISNLSSDCNATNETDFTDCLGGNLSSNGISCWDKGNVIQLDNLKYSAVKGVPAPVSPSLLGSFSGGGRGGSITLCDSDRDCSAHNGCKDGKCVWVGCREDGHCKEEQVCSNYECLDFECEIDGDCGGDDEVCKNHQCVKLFDIIIKEFPSKAVPGEFFEFTYFLKGMANISDDVTINFWVERDGEVISSGQDVIYVGYFEELSRTAKLLMPSIVEPGVYTFFVELSYGFYKVKSFRTIEIGENLEVILLDTGWNIADYLILIFVLLIVGLIYYFKRDYIRSLNGRNVFSEKEDVKKFIVLNEKIKIPIEDIISEKNFKPKKIKNEKVKQDWAKLIPEPSEWGKKYKEKIVDWAKLVPNSKLWGKGRKSFEYGKVKELKPKN